MSNLQPEARREHRDGFLPGRRAQDHLLAGHQRNARPLASPALLGDESKGAGGQAVISSPATQRDARPAAQGQAAESGQDNQSVRKVTGMHVHAKNSLTPGIRPSMATPARRGDDRNTICGSGDEESLMAKGLSDFRVVPTQARHEPDLRRAERTPVTKAGYYVFDQDASA
jgi:hypothetical protein